MKKVIAAIVCVLIVLVLSFQNRVTAENPTCLISDEEWKMICDMYNEDRESLADTALGFSKETSIAVKNLVLTKEDCYKYYYYVCVEDVPFEKFSDFQFDHKGIMIPTSETSDTLYMYEDGKYKFVQSRGGGPADELLNMEKARDIAYRATGTRNADIWCVQLIPQGMTLVIAECGDKEIIMPIGNMSRLYGFTDEWYDSKEFIELLNQIELPDYSEGGYGVSGINTILG